MVGKKLDDQAVFEVARKIGSPETRQAYLLQICDGEPEMAQRIEALLRAHDESVSFLECPPPGLSDALTTEQTVPEKPGTQIGAYKILQDLAGTLKFFGWFSPTRKQAVSLRPLSCVPATFPPKTSCVPATFPSLRPSLRPPGCVPATSPCDLSGRTVRVSSIIDVGRNCHAHMCT